MSVRKLIKKWDFLAEFGQNDKMFWRKTRNGIELNPFQYMVFLQQDLGIRRMRMNGAVFLVQVIGKRILFISTSELSQIVIEYVQKHFPKECGDAERIEILDMLVKTSFNFYKEAVLSFLPVIEALPHHDTQHHSIVAFSNTIAKVTSTGIQTIPYDDYDGAIFQDNIVPRDFHPNKNPLQGVFYQFTLNLAGQDEELFQALVIVLGYLLHRYKDPSNPKIVIVIDRVIGELESYNGGSGKSLWLKSIGFIRNMVELSGKQTQRGNRFLMQRVNTFSNVILLNDASKRENLELWYNYVTDVFVLERKYKQEQTIPAQFSPKIAITSNHIINRPEGNSSERRIHEVEISDHYGKHRNPFQDFGHNLYQDWDGEEWGLFDNFMLYCLQQYLEKGLIAPPVVNLPLRKMMADLGIEFIEFMDEKIEEGVIKFHKKDLFEEFRKGGYVQHKYLPKSSTFSKKIRKYLEYKGFQFIETPANSKRYFEIITEDALEDAAVKTIKDFDVDYKLVDTPNKLSRLEKKLKK
ncbi:MAG TPA: primase-helicase family protein [Salinimicrobium sp.]|nr:primase-helicase family protein [Salinimicrobium sp.]